MTNRSGVNGEPTSASAMSGKEDGTEAVPPGGGEPDGAEAVPPGEGADETGR
jgi:hypothetical protein